MGLIRGISFTRLLTGSVLGILLCLNGTPPALAQGGLAAFSQSQNKFLSVDQAYQLAVEQIDAQTIRLYWQITDGYYLYRHGFKARLTDETGAVAGALTIPDGLKKTDEFFGDVEVYYSSADLHFSSERPFGTAKLAVTSQGCADAGLCYPPNTQVFTVENGGITAGEPPFLGAIGNTTPSNSPTLSLAQDLSEPGNDSPIDDGDLTLIGALFLAFLGGLILNTMPCVFPILSLKVLGFATGDPAQHRRHGWFYLSGVVASFVAVASVLIALQSAGRLIGWGFQLQTPAVVIALAYLFTAMGLSLSGVVQLGSGLMNIGGALAGQSGNKGSFFTGVLAVVVASPCTAPFMGSALGFALTQPPILALLVFVALGVGMASPMVLLSYSPAARNLLPKPGAWMETLKELLAFPLYATAVWLLWVAGKQAGIDTMAAALAGLVMLALGLFLYRGSVLRRTFAVICIAAAIALAGVRGPAPNDDISRHDDATVPWSTDALAALRDKGAPVFVDVTADWCITCIANEQAVLFTPAMIAAFADSGVTYMVADWTNYDADIGTFVKSHGRNGIPLYVMYPAGSGSTPVILPQLLTKSTVLEALASAR